MSILRMSFRHALAGAVIAFAGGCMYDVPPGEQSVYRPIVVPPGASLVAYASPSLLTFHADPGHTVYIYDEEAKKVTAAITASHAIDAHGTGDAKQMSESEAKMFDPNHHYRVYLVNAPPGSASPSSQPSAPGT